MYFPIRLNLVFILSLIGSLTYSQSTFEDVFKLKKAKISSTPASYYDLFVHDLNGNGQFEIITYENGLNCYEYGTNGFEKVDLPVLEDYKLNEVDNNCFLDWDNDGDVDVIALEETRYANTVVMLFENDGNRNFKKCIINERVTLPDYCYYLNTCDFDFNGMSDIFVHGYSQNDGGNNLLYLNRENAFDLTVDTVRIDGIHYPEYISDVNNDKVTDLIWGSGYSDGSNSFNFIEWCLPEGSFNPSGIYRDFNNDGIYDYVSEYYKYLSNKETACYEQSESELVRSNIWAFDWNNDGYTDLISNHDWSLYFYENNKSGGFTKKFSGYFVYGYDGIVPADMDQDGDLDLILGYNSLSFYENTTEQNRGINLKLTRSNLNYSFYNLKVKVFTGQSVQVKQYKIDYAVESGQSVYFHFGLGTVDKIDSIHVTWPSGLIQTQKDIPYSANIEIIEDFNGQPMPVSTLTGSVLYPDKALLEWEENMYDEERFIIQRKLDSDADYISIDTIPANSIQYYDNTYLAGQTVSYMLISNSKLGKAESNVLELVFGDALPAPEAAASLKLDSVSFDLVILAWDKVKDASQYVIERKTNNESSFEIIAKVDTASMVYRDYSVLENSMYTYRVMASNHGSYSSPSNEIEANVPYSLFKLSERINMEPHLLWRIMDFNGDGDKDFYYMNSDYNNKDVTATYVYENTDGTNFKDDPTKIERYLPHVYNSYAMPFYDFNKDNLPEVYASPDTITSFTENGNILFFKDSLKVEQKHLLAWAGYLNDDLCLDYIYRDYGSYPTENIYVKLSDVQRKGGDLLYNSHTHTDCFVVQDWNSDGLNDILVARDYNGYMTINYLINQNHDILKSQINITNRSEYPIGDVTRLDDCDFNNDGFFDLYLQCESKGYILTNRNNEEFTISHEFQNLSDIQLKDFNNDGYSDLIGYNSDQRVVESYINNQNGRFEIAQFDFDKAKYPKWIRSDDMDGDGDVDLIFGIDEDQPLAENHSRTEKVSEVWVFSNQITDVDKLEKEKLPIPANLKVELVGSKASFSWEQNSELSNLKYNIFLKNDKDEYLISSVTSLENGADYSCSGNYWSNSNFFNTTCLENGTYRWAVQTVDKDGRTSAFSQEQSFSVTQPALSKPDDFVVTVLSPTEINMYWSSKDTNVEFFEVQRKKEGDTAFETIGLRGLNDTFYSEIELAPNASYSYRVRAYNCTNESEFTKTITVQTPPYIYTPYKKYPIMISNSSKPKLADFDNNGKVDFLNKNNNRLEIYYGVNDTVSSPEYLDLTSFSSDYYSDTHYQLLDFDKNGYIDIVLASESQSANDKVIIHGFMNNGKAFTVMQLDTINLNGYSSFNIDDLDNDGDWDYYGNFMLDGWNSIATIVLKTDSTETFTAFEGSFIDCKHLVDLNKDGYKDIPMAKGSRYDDTDEVELISFAANEEWQGKVLYNDVWTHQSTLFLKFSDWNNDGWMDIFTYTYSDEDHYQFRILENNKGLSFKMLTPYSDVALEYEPYLNVIDINGDDISDAVFSGRRLNTYQNGYGNWIMIADLTNNFLSAQGPDLLSHNYISYTNFGDIDGDGDPELIVFNDDSYRGNTGIEIFNNNYYPSYTDEWRKPMPPVQLKQEAYGESGSILSWANNSNEIHESLYYNVQILNEAGEIIVSAESLNSGKRQIQNYGNCGINKFFIAHALPVGNYTWKVQAINKSMNASVFSEEANFSQEVRSGIDNVTVHPIINIDRKNKTITLANQYVPSNVRIYDLQGRVLYNQKIYSNQLDLNQLADITRFIIIELTTNNKVYHQKILW